MPTCLIIGAGPGLSQAIAYRFARGGHDVGLIARRPNVIEPLSAELSELGIRAVWATADAGDEEGLLDALASIEGRIGRTDVLIYNASVMRAASPLELTSDELRREFVVNVVSAFAASRTVAPAMIAKGTGAILFTGGGLALEPYPEWTSLAAGKAALRSLALSLFKEFSPLGIHVSVIAVCGIVEADGPFDPSRIAEEYWRLATAPNGLADRELIYQPEGTDPHYNDPNVGTPRRLRCRHMLANEFHIVAVRSTRLLKRLSRSIWPCSVCGTVRWIGSGSEWNATRGSLRARWVARLACSGSFGRRGAVFRRGGGVGSTYSLEAF